MNVKYCFFDWRHLRFCWYTKLGAFEQTFASVPPTIVIGNGQNSIAKEIQMFPFLNNGGNGGQWKIKQPVRVLFACVCLPHSVAELRLRLPGELGVQPDMPSAGCAFSACPVTWAQLTGGGREAPISRSQSRLTLAHAFCTLASLPPFAAKPLCAFLSSSSSFLTSVNQIPPLKKFLFGTWHLILAVLDYKINGSTHKTGLPPKKVT